ncbi:Flavin-containing monooxygenase ustF2 [Pseudocercospora fuligena]|uniref:Flavin-containing monooxygenase ustF2 n=1 Tax=Pseudocercospora fuligena TaxID=685502 RepID=A0A8H6RA53_9PEZI|nr:Flavin-containing monooxygenase ustF2 [Pseudocercospora fuligena]
MTLSDQSWPTGTPLMPSNRQVKQYLEEYCNQLRQKCKHKKLLRIGYNAAVVEVKKCQKDYSNKWRTKVQVLQSETPAYEYLYSDFVVVAAGNYQTPFYPDYPGLNDWRAIHPKSVSHALDYQNPDDFRDKNALMVGYGASGFDISSKIAQAAKSLVLSTSRPNQALAPGVNLAMPEISHLNASNRTVTFQSVDKPGSDKSGGVYRQIDKIIFCTGYKYNFDFIKTPDGGPLLDQGFMVAEAYEHTIYHPDPTLAFLGLPKGGLSFIIAEAQSALIARVFKGRLPIPSRPQMKSIIDQQKKDWKAKVRKNEVRESSYHDLAGGKDKEYVNRLWKECQDATPPSAPNLGKAPPYWCGCMDAARGQVAAVRLKYKALEGRRFMHSTYASVGGVLPFACPEHGLPLQEVSIGGGLVCCYIGQ